MWGELSPHGKEKFQTFTCFNLELFQILFKNGQFYVEISALRNSDDVRSCSLFSLVTYHDTEPGKGSYVSNLNSAQAPSNSVSFSRTILTDTLSLAS